MMRLSAPELPSAVHRLSTIIGPVEEEAVPHSVLVGCSRLLSRAVVAPKPFAESIETGIDQALRQVHLIEFIAHLPLEIMRDDDPLHTVHVICNPLVQLSGRIGQHGEQGELIDDPIIK